ncbi:MAG: M48 family metallopeptidase [Desulfobulbaceae bacterium]|nr:M48 family metallopeptidase [Desulfobulbaceae bacterium]
MNLYGLIILFALLADFLLGALADWLNLKALDPKLPAEFADCYDPAEYARSQAYTRAKSRFGQISTTFDLAVLLLFWWGGGFAWLDQLVRGWASGEVARGLLFFALLLLSKSLLSLPFSVYSTFGIEARFGFNRTTPATFIADLVKGLLLAVVLGGPLLGAILYLFAKAGALAWLWCWGAVSLFTLFVQFIAPTWIMPLFNKFTPLPEGELRTAIFAFAAQVSFPLQNVFVMDGSKRSAKSNAFFTGFGRNRRIALFDTLIDKHSVPELVGVLAHEIGHYKKKHILKSMLLGLVHAGVMFYLLAFFLSRPELYAAFGIESPSLYTGLIFFGLLFTPLEMALSPFLHYLSRKHEYQADRFAADETGNPAGMAAALKKLSVSNLANLTPHPFYVVLHYSHPPLLARLRALAEVK